MGMGSVVAVSMYTGVTVSCIGWRMDSFSLGGGRDALLSSSLNVVLLLNLGLNCLILASLFLKAIFFGRLSLSETKKMAERLINYVLFKGLFLAWVVPPEMIQIALWLAWFAIFGFLKMFQGLARDRLERLNASPTATVLSHARVFFVLILILFSALFWTQFCILVFRDSGINTLLLLLFEPLGIALDTSQAVVVHGMQLLDTWHCKLADISSPFTSLQPSERSAAGAAREWRGSMVRNSTFAMDLVSLLLALGHCLHIWWLRGLAFQVVDVILFLNLRALLSAILKKIKAFMRLRTAMNTLQGALPDATEEELLSYDEDCAICKEPMARAKRLPCAHLFHLPCLQSWLDQGLADTYSCPTCRRPLFMGTPRMCATHVQRGRQIAEGDLIDRNRRPRGQADNGGEEHGDANQLTSLSDTFSSQQWNSTGVNAWNTLSPGLAGDGEGSSAEAVTARLGYIQIMARHLSGGARSSSMQNQSNEGSWRWWPFSYHIGDVRGSHNQRNSGLFRSRGVVGSQTEAMVHRVREVLPHISEEVIVQDLQRTNSVTATVNNLL